MNLRLRIVSGAVLLAVLFAALWVGTPAATALVAAAVAVAAWEYSALAGGIGLRPPAWLLYPLALWLAIRLAFPAAYQDAQWPLLAALAAGLPATVVLRSGFDRWAAAVAGSVYLGFGLSFYLALFLWRPSDTQHFGLRLVVLVLLGVMACDTVAYFAGSAFGRRSFFASISPRKTVEGALAGALAAIVVVAAAGPALIGIGAVTGAGMGALIGVAAQAGDLVESAIKRQAGVKESSALIPGHGGLLDRFDSLILVAPVAFHFVNYVAGVGVGQPVCVFTHAR